jgi:GNAT superfamily N-acetyltransferase
MGTAAQLERPPAEEELRIRTLSMDDLSDVVRIDEGHTGIPKPTYWAGVFDSFVATAQRPVRVGLGAELDGRLIGYLLGEVRAFEFGSEPCGWVFAVGVDPEYLRGSVGTRLLRQAGVRFHSLGVRRLRTMVERSDIPLMSFFRSSGFVGGSFYQLEMDLGGES